MSIYGDRRENPNITIKDKPNPIKHDYYAQTMLEAEEIIK
jgi:hypothetical protein